IPFEISDVSFLSSIVLLDVLKYKPLVPIEGILFTHTFHWSPDLHDVNSFPFLSSQTPFTFLSLVGTVIISSLNQGSLLKTVILFFCSVRSIVLNKSFCV